MNKIQLIICAVRTTLQDGRTCFGVYLQTKVKSDLRPTLLHLGATFDAGSFDWDQVKGLGISNLCTRAIASSSMTCGKILALATQRVVDFREKLGIKLCVFKIGVTSNPVTRFADYREKAFTSMWLVWVSRSVDLVHMLEASLIQQFHREIGCQNKGGTGGEGCLNKSNPPSPPYFVYITGGGADQPRRVG